MGKGPNYLHHGELGLHRQRRKNKTHISSCWQTRNNNFTYLHRKLFSDRCVIITHTQVHTPGLTEPLAKPRTLLVPPPPEPGLNSPFWPTGLLTQSGHVGLRHREDNTFFQTLSLRGCTLSEVTHKQPKRKSSPKNEKKVESPHNIFWCFIEEQHGSYLQNNWCTREVVGVYKLICTWRVEITLFQINLRSWGFQRWAGLSFNFGHFIFQLQLFRRTLQHCFAVKLQKCCVDSETSLDLLSTWGCMNNDKAFIFGWTLPSSCSLWCKHCIHYASQLRNKG